MISIRGAPGSGRSFLFRADAADQTGAEGDAIAPGIEESVFFWQKLGGVDLLDESAGAVDFSGSSDDAGEDGRLALMPAILGQGNEEAGGLKRVALLMEGQGFEKTEVNILRVDFTTVANDGEHAVHGEVYDTMVRETIAYALDGAWQEAYGHRFGEEP